MAVASATFREEVADEFERWICRHCAHTRWTSPFTTPSGNAVACPNCRRADWHYTIEPIPKV